jgi:hypothetical protein
MTIAEQIYAIAKTLPPDQADEIICSETMAKRVTAN